MQAEEIGSGSSHALLRKNYTENPALVLRFFMVLYAPLPATRSACLLYYSSATAAPRGEVTGLRTACGAGRQLRGAHAS